MYDGFKYELSDGKGNILESTDTRILEQEINLSLDALNSDFTQTYHEKLGLLDKETGDRKIQQARLGILKNKAHEKTLLKLDKEIQLEYRLRKKGILDSTSCDECQRMVYSPKKVITKKILGITTGHKLEDK